MDPFDIATPAGKLIQTAFVTPDIRATMSEMTRTMKIGPWFLREHGVFPKQSYKGRPTDMALSIAMGYAGDMQFELIQQLDRKPSVYGDMVGKRGFGLHHYGVAVDDYDAAIRHYAGRGFILVYEAEVANGARVGYFDVGDALPAMIEVIEYLPATQAMFAAFREAARTWDGSDPVRPLAPVKT